MLDLEITKFYNDVKDPSWPEIHGYIDYTRLPNDIKNECIKLHQFQYHRTKNSSTEHWLNLTTYVCMYKNLAYVPVPKCAYMYHTTLFTNLGWKKVPLHQVDIENTKFFGLLTNPLQRRLKGITQWITQCYEIDEPKQSEDNPWIKVSSEVDWKQLHDDLKTKYFNRLLSTIYVGDIHSLSYAETFGNLLHKVNWIPMDALSDNEVKTSMMNFFNLHGHDIQLPLNDARLHVSPKNKLELFDYVKTAFHSDPDNIYYFYKIYSNDLKLYYNLLDTFTTDWQHI